MNLNDIMFQLEQLGSEQIRAIYEKHGYFEPFFGVRVGDLNKLIKKYKLKNNHQLAIELFNTENYDAMYLAGLIADPTKVDKTLLDAWISKSRNFAIDEYCIAPVGAKSSIGYAYAKSLIEDKDNPHRSCGYNMLVFYLANVQDDMIDKTYLKALLEDIKTSIHSQPNRVRYTMNSLVSAIGISVPTLYDDAYDVAEAIGKVSVDMGKTACKVPLASNVLDKAKAANRLGFKRK